MNPVNFRFRLKTDVLFGSDVSTALADPLQARGFSRPLIIIDKAVAKLEIAKRSIESLSSKLHVEAVYENEVAEPAYDYLDTVTNHFRNLNPDCIIGIGGGSSMDLAKGVATMLANPGKGVEYRGFNLVKVPPKPTILIPTTAGTGSEVTPTAVFIEKSEKRKLGINSDYLFPFLAILDPSWLTGSPRKVAVSSGMDALVHTLESFVSKVSSPYSRFFAREAFSLIFNNLKRAIDEPSSLEHQSNVLLGSHYAGVSLLNSSSGPAGALSYALGANFNVPHGMAGAVFLPRVASVNVARGSDSYDELYDLIAGVKKVAPSEKANAFVGELQTLCDYLEIPKTLTGFGVKKEHQKLMKDEAFRLAGSMANNPVPFGENEFNEIYDIMVEG